MQSLSSTRLAEALRDAPGYRRRTASGWKCRRLSGCARMAMEDHLALGSKSLDREMQAIDTVRVGNRRDDVTVSGNLSIIL
jgi:hypothetical protein